MRLIAGLLSEFLGKSWGIQAIFIHHSTRAKVSSFKKIEEIVCETNDFSK